MVVATTLISLTPMAAFGAIYPIIRGERDEILRGIGFSPWHVEEGWGRSAETVQKDSELLKGLHANVVRIWGACTDSRAKRFADLGMGVFVMAPLVQRHTSDLTLFADGTTGAAKMPIYGMPSVREEHRQLAADSAKHHAKFSNISLLILGNEYSWVGKNSSGNWVYRGFDDYTLGGFRDRWLPSRFSSVENMKELTGAQGGNWSDVNPLATPKLKFEWWLYLRQEFEGFMKAGYEGAKEYAPDIPVSNAKFMGNWDPAADHAKLSFQDYGGQNLYSDWYNDFTVYCAKLDELISYAGSKPVVLLESGYKNKAGTEEEAAAARLYKQMLPLTYMRPEVAGVCVYLFNDDSPTKTRGLLDSYHNPKQSYYAVSEVYAALEEFNDLLANAKCPPIVGLTTQIPQSIIEGRRNYHEIARILYSRGVRLQMVPSDELSQCPLRSPQKLILADSILYVDPDGGNDSENGIRKHLECGGEILYISEKPYEMLYGEPDAPANFRLCEMGIDPTNADEIWRNVGLFIHDNFLSGENVEGTGIGPGPENIRILDVQVSTEDLSWSVHPTLLYSGRRVLMVIVNTGASEVEEVKVTLGFKGSASGWQPKPCVLASGNDIELSISESPELPSWWTGGETQVKLAGLILKNLDTYAFLDIGEVP